MERGQSFAIAVTLVMHFNMPLFKATFEKQLVQQDNLIVKVF